MTAESTSIPNERDVRAVEERLAALYAALPPAQQMVLEAIIDTGLTVVTATSDTAGYMDFSNPVAMEEYVRYKTTQLREEARRARVLADTRAGASGSGRRWHLAPLLDWFGRAPAPQPQTGAPGTAPT